MSWLERPRTRRRALPPVRAARPPAAPGGGGRAAPRVGDAAAEGAPGGQLADHRHAAEAETERNAARY